MPHTSIKTALSTGLRHAKSTLATIDALIERSPALAGQEALIASLREPLMADIELLQGALCLEASKPTGHLDPEQKDAEAAEPARALIQAFVNKHRISCAESIYSRDSIQVEAPVLLEDLCNLVGYCEKTEDGEND